MSLAMQIPLYSPLNIWLSGHWLHNWSPDLDTGPSSVKRSKTCTLAFHATSFHGCVWWSLESVETVMLHDCWSMGGMALQRAPWHSIWRGLRMSPFITQQPWRGTCSLTAGLLPSHLSKACWPCWSLLTLQKLKLTMSTTRWPTSHQSAHPMTLQLDLSGGPPRMAPQHSLALLQPSQMGST